MKTARQASPLTVARLRHQRSERRSFFYGGQYPQVIENRLFWVTRAIAAQRIILTLANERLRRPTAPAATWRRVEGSFREHFEKPG